MMAEAIARKISLKSQPVMNPTALINPLLLGIFLMILYVESNNRLWLLGAGVCMGMSVLFKFHTGVIGVVGFAVFLSLKEQALGLFGNEIEDSASEGGGAAIGFSFCASHRTSISFPNETVSCRRRATSCIWRPWDLSTGSTPSGSRARADAPGK